MSDTRSFSLESFHIIQLQTTLNIQLPSLAVPSDHAQWLKVVNTAQLSEKEQPVIFNNMTGDNQLEFIPFLTNIIQRLFVLGKIPIFEPPKILSKTSIQGNEDHIALAIELPFIQFIPLDAYKVCIDAALKLSPWLAQNPITPTNKASLFSAIENDVIQPLSQLVMSGKSTIPVLSAAHSLQIPFHHLGLGVYQLGWGSRAKRLDRSLCGDDSSIGVKLSQNKVYTANLIQMAGLPAPKHVTVSSHQEALEAAKRLGYPVVIKPMDLDRGEGITVDIDNDNDLKQAFDTAKPLTSLDQVLVERQVAGVCHRLFISHGKLLYAVKRLPMSVQGDGLHTVTELVDNDINIQKQKAPWSRSEIQPIDEQAVSVMKLAGFLPESIPESGVWVPLRRIESTQHGGVDVDVTQWVHPENVSIAIESAELLGLKIAGVDIICEDITQPWFENGAIINEVNSAPLLGGGEVSQSYLPQFFAGFIDNNGQIPIETVATKELATEQQIRYKKQGVRCFITNSTETIHSSGRTVPMPFDDIKQRLRALIFRSDVDAITVFRG